MKETKDELSFDQIGKKGQKDSCTTVQYAAVSLRNYFTSSHP